MFNIKKAAVAAAVGFALSFLLCIVATGKFGMAFLRGIIFAAVFAAGAIAIDFLNSRFLEGEGGEFSSLSSNTPQKKTVAKTTGNTVSIVIDDATLTEEPSAPDFDVIANGGLLKNLDPKEKKTPKKEVETPEQAPASVQKPAVQDEAGEGVNATDKTSGDAFEEKKPAKAESIPQGKGGKAESPSTSGKKATGGKGQAKKEDVSPAAQESEGFKPMQLDAISGGAKKSENAAERKHERLQQIDELPDFAALSSGSEAQRDDALISDSEFAESEPDEDEGGDEDNVSSAPRGEIPVDYDSETIASAIRTLLKRDE